jgi:hypothetical protein
MSFASAYEIANGTLVEIRLKDTVFRGEFNIHLIQTGYRNPAKDRVVLDQPVELPIGKKHTGSVSFPVLEIRQSKFRCLLRIISGYRHHIME